MKRNYKVEVVRSEKGNLAEVWMPPVDSKDGCMIARFHISFVPAMISALKRFEQKEGRK